jgi:hypothetical protein
MCFSDEETPRSREAFPDGKLQDLLLDGGTDRKESFLWKVLGRGQLVGHGFNFSFLIGY